MLQILHSNASFESLSKIYSDLHFVNVPTDVMPQRVEAHRKRLSDAIMLYSYLELGQRYGIPSIIKGGIDKSILENKSLFKDKFEEKWSVDHKCDTKGCQDCLTVDGGMKPNRMICADKLAGVTKFQNSDLKVVSGCPRKPAPSSKYCGDCKNSESPVMISTSVSKETKANLRKRRSNTAQFKETSQDQIYVIESLLGKKTIDAGIFWKVKWLGVPESESTWEPAKNIQGWMKAFYDEDRRRFGKTLPVPKIKCQKKLGGQTQYYFNWGEIDGEKSSEDRWVTEDFFQIASEDGDLVSQMENISCNTKKTKDKRDRRHTVGILVGTKPCGTVVLFNELYGAESVTQVYASGLDYVSNLPEADKPKVINYDDACHLVKFARNHYKKKNLQNEHTKFMAEVPIVVDKFHFRNHVDKWCHENCNPYQIRELDGVNTESCEQTFHWVNQFTAVKSMNEPHFWLFFTALFEMHNLSKLGQLRSVANPKSNLRWEIVSDVEDYKHHFVKQNKESIQQHYGDKDPKKDITQDIDILSEEMNDMNINKYQCSECGAKYKVAWTLKSHMTKKHERSMITDTVSKNTIKCDKCNLDFESDRALQEHNLTHEPTILYDCQLCQEAFTCKETFELHQAIHTPAKNYYVCKICDEVFLNESECQQHYQSHLACFICMRLCSTSKQLKRHISSHK